ncbi:MAG TPA: hypothetical protein VLI72_04210 [Methylibium sp.]|nr:hypothetical protein [Methylibium sp.]
MDRLRCLIAVLATALLAACGGGDDDGLDGGRESALAAPGAPVLVQTADFQLPPIANPPDRRPLAGMQLGRVLGQRGAAAPAGLTVELLDATNPSSPAVLASALTSTGGGFSIASTASLAPANRWLRVTLGDGSVLRAYATGWTEITPGSEVAVREITRLRQAGAFATLDLQGAELAQAQASLSLVWLGRFAERTVPLALSGLSASLVTQGPWNRLLERFGAAVPSDGGGDIAGLMPAIGARWLSSVTLDDAPPSSATFATLCPVIGGDPDVRSCLIRHPDSTDLGDYYTMGRTGLSLWVGANESNADVLGAILLQIGSIPLLEFPHAVGTRVVYDQPDLALPQFPIPVRVAVKITRRTYPTAPVQALGTTVRAVQVVLDYEIAILDPATHQQVDLLTRERRWFSPGSSRVRIEAEGLVRDAGTVYGGSVAVLANAIEGGEPEPSAPPAAGVADVRALALRHRHAVHSPTLGRIYVATHTALRGQILELDANTLATLRTAYTKAFPGRLAVSADGQRLYAGLDGGELVEYRTTDLSIRQRRRLPADPYGAPYDRFQDMAVDPFDASRLLVLAGRSSVFGGSGAVLVYRDGSVVLRDAPRYNANDYGWGYYMPNAIAWSSQPDEFLTAFLGSPQSVYRFRAGATATTELSSLERVESVGWRDIGGRLIDDGGQILDARSFATLRTLRLGTLGLYRCDRLELGANLCEIGRRGVYAYSPPYFVRFDNSGRFLGSYRPSLQRISNGCPELGHGDDFRFADLELAPMGGGRLLARAVGADLGEKCSLQVWALRGAYP